MIPPIRTITVHRTPLNKVCVSSERWDHMLSVEEFRKLAAEGLAVCDQIERAEAERQAMRGSQG